MSNEAIIEKRKKLIPWNSILMLYNVDLLRLSTFKKSTKLGLFLPVP